MSDEDFSSILGGALYLKQPLVEIMSECSQSEDTYDKNEERRYVDPSKINIKRSHNHVFSMQTNTNSANTLEQIDLNRQKAGDSSSPHFVAREKVIQEEPNLTRT